MPDVATTPLVKEIPPKAADLSEWYQAVCYKAELVSLAPVRGCVVLRPYGYAMWERLQQVLDARFKETGHENAYFPLLIPKSLLAREEQHVAGLHTRSCLGHAGRRRSVSEPLAIRPTSEVVIGTMYAQWIQSYRDLPRPDQSVGQRLALGKADAAVFAHARVFVAGRPHGSCQRG